MIGVRVAIEDYIEEKREDKEDKKDKWNKLLDHQRSMILNKMSSYGENAGMNLTPEFPETINQPSLTESTIKLNHIMKNMELGTTSHLC